MRFSWAKIARLEFSEKQERAERHSAAFSLEGLSHLYVANCMKFIIADRISASLVRRTSLTVGNFENKREVSTAKAVS